MPITREARRLSGNDIGKHIEFLGKEPGNGLTYRTFGTITRIEHEEDCVAIDIGYGERLVKANDLVTITGTKTPAGLDLHKSVLDQDG